MTLTLDIFHSELSLRALGGLFIVALSRYCDAPNPGGQIFIYLFIYLFLAIGQAYRDREISIVIGFLYLTHICVLCSWPSHTQLCRGQLSPSLSRQNSLIARVTPLCVHLRPIVCARPWPALSRPKILCCDIISPHSGKLYRDIKILCCDTRTLQKAQLYREKEFLCHDIEILALIKLLSQPWPIATAVPVATRDPLSRHCHDRKLEPLS